MFFHRFTHCFFFDKYPLRAKPMTTTIMRPSTKDTIGSSKTPCEITLNMN